MPSGKIRPLQDYPGGWLVAVRRAVAAPERWLEFPLVIPADATCPSPDTAHRRVQTLPAAFARYPGLYPDVSSALAAGGTVKFRRRAEAGLLRFEVCFFPHGARTAELVEKALGGG
jgi:hypothetical protein